MGLEDGERGLIRRESRVILCGDGREGIGGLRG